MQLSRSIFVGEAYCGGTPGEVLYWGALAASLAAALLLCACAALSNDTRADRR